MTDYIIYIFDINSITGSYKEKPFKINIVYFNYNKLSI